MLEAEFGDAVETAYVESIDGGADAERVIRQFASQGYGLVFGTSFNHMNPMARVASQSRHRLRTCHRLHAGYHLAIYHTWETANTIAPFNDAVPQEVRDMVMAKKEEIGTGAFHPSGGAADGAGL